MEAYPIMLSIKGKEAVVVGGGAIAYRKMIGLLQAGALVTVVSPELHEKVEQLYLESRIEWKKKEFEPPDILSAWVVIAATNSHVVNELIALSAENHQLINIVDNPGASNFHVPAKLTRGDLTISVATAGASPILAKAIRDELSLIYDESYRDYLQFLAEVREKIRHSTLDQAAKKQYLKEVTSDTFRQSNEKQQGIIKLLDGFVSEGTIRTKR